MKIRGYGDSIRLTSIPGRDIASLLRGISPGDRVEARIISREGNIALLDIAGKRIRADFTTGIPAGNIVELVLSEKSRTGALFRLPPGADASELPALLKQFFLTGDRVADRATVAELWRLLTSGRAGLAEINLFLAGIKKDNLKENKISELVNRLKNRKVPLQTLIDISLVEAAKLPAPIFSAILYLMERSGRKQRLAAGDERIDEILKDIEVLDDRLFTDLLKLLTEPGPDKEGYGWFTLPGENESSELEYIYRDNTFFITFSLSELGRLGLLIRSEKGYTAISIGAENDRAVEEIEANINELKRALHKNGVDAGQITFFNAKKVLDKLYMLCNDIHLTSGLDVKI